VPRLAIGTGSLPPVDRARSNPWLAVAIAAGALLVLAWIGWAIYVTGQNGAGAGLGVVIAWPAMLAALALISLPFIGGYVLVKRLSDGEGSTATADAEESQDEEEPEEPAEDEEQAEEEGSGGDEDDTDDEDEDEDEDDEDEDDESEPDPEPEASKAS
jgi:hypothetical protein